MQKEPFPNKKGFRVWLNNDEQMKIKQFYEEQPKKKLAIQLMINCGLRSDEVTRISKNNIRSLNSQDYQAQVIEIEDGKTGYREVPTPSEIAKNIRMIANAAQKSKNEPIINISKRQVQRYVTDAASSLAEKTGKEDWNEVSAHDLRRTWATTTYYKLNSSDIAKSAIMRWGGWVDEQTFEQNYLGRPPENVVAELAHEAGIA